MDIYEQANKCFHNGSWNATIDYLKEFLQVDYNQEKYISCLKIFMLYEKIGNSEAGIPTLIESSRYDKDRAECVYALVHYYVLRGEYDMAFKCYSQIKTYYEELYLSDDTISDRLEFNRSVYEFFLPYDMIIVSQRTGNFMTGIKMYEIIFRQKFTTDEHWRTGNLIHNLRFFLSYTTPEFTTLFIEYINFLGNMSIRLDIEQIENYITELDSSKKKEIKIISAKYSKKILFYTGFSYHAWNYTSMIQNGVGGSETCVANIASHFPENYEIYVCGGVKEEKVGNVSYVAIQNIPALLKNNTFYSVIISRYLGFLEDYPYIVTHKLYIWIHDVHIIPYKMNDKIDVISTLHKWDCKIDGYVCLTEWHLNKIKKIYDFITDKLLIIPNGIDSVEFNPNALKKKNLFVFTSRPERGYDRLFELWQDIVKALPDAELKLATYGVGPNEMQQKFIDQNKSVEFLGCLCHSELYSLLATAEYWLYPTAFEETFCLTALEMLHSQVICLYYPVGALPNTLGKYGKVVSHGKEIEELIRFSYKDDEKDLFRKVGLEYAQTFDWSHIYEKWAKILF